MKYGFSSIEYLKAHGEEPKGKGHWAFEIKGAEVPEISPEVFTEWDGSKINTIFWVDGFLTLTEAKKEAAKMLKACMIPEYTTVYIAS